MKRLMDGIKNALNICLGVKKGDNVVILTDENKRDIGYLFHKKALKIGADSILVDMAPRKADGQEPPSAIAALMKQADVVICPTTKSMTHTNARISANKKGARIATLPNITADIIARGLNVDFEAMGEFTKKIADILSIGRTVMLTSPAGTELEMSIKGKKGIADTGFILNKGDMGNLPAGEAFLAPVEKSANGILVIDGTIGGTGKIKTPVKLYIKDGFVTKIYGNREARILRKQIAPFGKPGRNIAELGIGTNKKAKLSGVVLEDEKVYGTVHVALGNNISMGGTCGVGIHLDGIILRPTLTIDDRVILSNGRFRV